MLIEPKLWRFNFIFNQWFKPSVNSVRRYEEKSRDGSAKPSNLEIAAELLSGIAYDAAFRIREIRIRNQELMILPGYFYGH